MNDTLIFTTTDPEDRTIHLRKKGWDHIRKRHPELSRKRHEIKSTIENPDFITENTTRRSLAYTKTSSIYLYLNVYAGMDNKYSEGQVLTAFIEKEPPKGDVVWHRKT